MRKFNQVFGVAAVSMAFFGAVIASAGITGSAGTWEGAGAVFNIDGTQLSTFTVEVVNTAIDEHDVVSQVTIGLPDGSQKQFKQTMRDTDHGFTITSDDGNGGGYCLGDGLCMSYVGTDDGHGNTSGDAVTIILDGNYSERVLITQLQNGKATQLIREHLVKLN
jgi:hypothetical protein